MSNYDDIPSNEGKRMFTRLKQQIIEMCPFMAKHNIIKIKRFNDNIEIIYDNNEMVTIDLYLYNEVVKNFKINVDDIDIVDTVTKTDLLIKFKDGRNIVFNISRKIDRRIYDNV